MQITNIGYDEENQHSKIAYIKKQRICALKRAKYNIYEGHMQRNC